MTLSDRVALAFTAPLDSGPPDLERVVLLLALVAALPWIAWLLFERFAAVVARVITLATGRRDPVVATARGGGDGMVGLIGVVRRPLAPRGKVFVRGELWDAVADEAAAPEVALTAGRRVQVRGLDGLTLRVVPAAELEVASPQSAEPAPGPRSGEGAAGSVHCLDFEPQSLQEISGCPR